MNDQQTNKTIQWLSSRGDVVRTCSFLKELMSSHDAAEVIHLWLERGFTSERSQIDKVRELMAELEGIVDYCPNEALLLMAALQPIASDLYLYEIYDSIGLWHHEIELKKSR